MTSTRSHQTTTTPFAKLSKRIELTVDAVMVLLLTFLCWVVGSNCHVGGCKACTQQNKFTTVHTPPKNRADDNQRYTGTGFLPTVVVCVWQAHQCLIACTCRGVQTLALYQYRYDIIFSKAINGLHPRCDTS